MALNDKLINYGNLAEFHNQILNDTGSTTGSTWSSSKIASELSNISVDMLQEVTYAELKALRDNKQLVPGQQYRITDYVTTTAQANTQSAGHQFDIIVVADSEDKLNENARAINHPEYISAMIVDNGDDAKFIYQRYPEGDDENGYAWVYNLTDGGESGRGLITDFTDIDWVDWDNIDTSDLIYTDTLTLAIGDNVDMDGTDVEVTDFSSQAANLDYFANSKLESWELKYCLDNDTIRFAWADETNGKGVIYYMKDEWNNECPYDFKNIQFKRYAITNVSTTGYTQDETSALSETFLFGNNGNKCFATKDVYGNWVPANESHQSGSDSQNTSIEWEIDENTFAWYYTFNGEKKESADGEIELYDITSQKLILSPECIQWLESEDSGNDISDNCYNNSIKPRTWEYFGDDAYYKGRIVLNDIVFLNGVSYCYYNNEDEYWEYSTVCCCGNVFGVECRNNTIGNNVYYNSIGNGFQNNTIGNDVYNNTIGNDVYQNTIGNNVYYNSIGNEFRYNTIGNEFRYNTIGNYFGSNTIGNGFQNNTIGNNVYNNTIGNDVYQNTIGNNVYYNSIGNDVYNNTIGNYFQYNTIGNNFQYNRLGEGVQYLDFTTNYGSVTLQYLYVLSGYKYNAKTSVPTGITANAVYSQTIGFNTAGSFVVKNMLD